MFYFKDSENRYSQTKTGSTGSLIKYVEKHSCYKAAEKLLLALAEKNKECAVEIFPPKLKKKSVVDFYFEKIELSEEEINAFKLLGKDKNALLEKTPIIIQLHFRFKSDDYKEDALDFIIRKYRYIGYNAEKCNYSGTGWIKQQIQSEFILTYKSPEKIFFKCNNMKKSFPASITSLYIICNIPDDDERKYARLFVTSMLEHLSEITGSKIYIDLLKEKSEDGQLLNPCPLKITEMKDFRTKKDFFYGKYGKLLNKYSIPKKTFNKHSFNRDYKIVNFVKYMGGDFIPELLQLEYPDNNLKSKEVAVSIFTQILMKRYPLVTYICTDIGKMMSQLLYDSLKEFRKHLPSRSILEGRKKLMEYHDSLVYVFEQLYEDDVFDEMEIEHRKTQKQIKQDRKIYEFFAEKLPSPWKEFTEPEELVHESHIMENCIRTYCQDLTAAECGLYWAEINGRRYNAEVIFNKDENRMNLIQMFGKRNEKPVRKDVLAFEEYVRNFKYSVKNRGGEEMNNTDSLKESVTKGTLYRYGFDRHNKANKICTVLKYLSLTHPQLQMPELRGIFEQNFAASLLTEIILNSRWYKDSVTIGNELSFFSKDDYTYIFNKFLTLYDELSEYIKKVNVHLTIESFSSNYDGGYYGEIYDNANYNYNKEERF